MIEKFVPIEGYEGLYEVSNIGNVKSLNYRHTGKEEVLSPGVRRGYLFVTLCKEGKVRHYDIQQLVAKAFISNPNGYTCVNHKDENKQNNCVDNLEWCSYSYNNTYNNRHLKIGKKVREKLSIPIYCVELDKVFKSSHEAERQTGINDGNIRSCLKGKRKSAGGYHWRYL